MMAGIDESSQHRQASTAVPIDVTARQRLAVRVITVAAMLAVMAALMQIHDSITGRGNMWIAFLSMGITAWWITIAIYMSARRGR